MWIILVAVIKTGKIQKNTIIKQSMINLTINYKFKVKIEEGNT